MVTASFSKKVKIREEFSPTAAPVDSIKFSGAREDNLCSKAVYDWNPFITRNEQIEKSYSYKDVVTKWEKDAQGHVVTRVGRVVTGTGGAVAGHVLEHISGLPCGAPEILGGFGGSLASELVEPVVKLFTKPEMVKQKNYAIEASNVIEPGGPVDEACKQINKNVNHGYFLWWSKEKHLGSFLKGIASRYGREQSEVKSLLPKIKGERTTRSVIIPILEDCKYANLYETRFDTTHGAEGSCITQAIEDFSDAPIGRAVKAIREGFDYEVACGILPYCSESREKIAESKFRELKDKLPAIIDYLKD